LPADLERLLHDLRGPLNSAVMHLEVVKRAGVSDPLAKQSLETIGQELVRLARNAARRVLGGRAGPQLDWRWWTCGRSSGRRCARLGRLA